MGPKKKGKGQGPDQDADKVQILNNKVQTLQKQLVLEQQQADNCRGSQNEIKQRVLYLQRDLKDQKEKISAMTHQYKQMQKEYNDELDMLNKTLQERQDQLSINEMMKKKIIR